MAKPVRERCDHCQKWVNSHNHTLGTLEGVVSEGVEISFSICSKCFDNKGLKPSYWDSWVEKQRLKNQEEKVVSG